MNVSDLRDTPDIRRELILDEPRDLPKDCEWIGGQIRPKDWKSARDSLVGSGLLFRLSSHCHETGCGIAVAAYAPYICRWNGTIAILKPDVSVVLCDPDSFGPPQGCFSGPPTLVVEIVSSGSDAVHRERKITAFQDAGTRLIWIVNPELRTVQIRRADGARQLLRDPAELSGEDVLPGFRVALADFLPRIPNLNSENPAA